jgi:hypothetical protein
MRLARSVAAALVAALVPALVPAAAHAQNSALEKLSVHGYLTQGYAESTELPFTGIPTDATGDYRTAALQFRYDISEHGNAVVQIRHRRLGTSLLQTVEPDVSLNWAYYQQRLGAASIKVGKLPLPRGIYNETRSVGTILPFYRAPVNTYIEGYETIDGASVASSIDLGKSWSLDGTAFGGGFDLDIPVSLPPAFQPQLLHLRMERAYGGQTWLNTPITGLRVGLGGMRFRSRKETDTSSTPETSLWNTSLDGDFGRVLARAEFTHVTPAGQHLIQYWGQLGVKVTSKLGVYVQDDVSNTNNLVAPGMRLKYRDSDDKAASVAYAFSPALVLKLEQHWVKGYNFDRFVSPMGAPRSSNYVIASVSTAF